MRWDLVLERRTKNRLNADITRKKLRQIAAAAERNRAMGFTGRVGKLGEPELVTDEDTGEEVWLYRVKLRLERVGDGEDDDGESQLRQVLAVVSRLAEAFGWAVMNSGQRPAGGDVSQLCAVGDPRPPFVVPELTEEVMKNRFEGVYERDEQIRLIHDAVTNHVSTLAAWRADEGVEVARSHVLLKGKPAGCKTMMFERFKRWYEQASPGAERVTFVDLHTATRAGVENWLLDRAEQGELADIVVFEEIEKLQPLDNLLPLVSLMGSGYVSKLNAHIGHRRQLANILVCATCNDEGVLRRWRNGAIWSRFAHKLHCPRPSRELMGRILLDTIGRTGGDESWAELALHFAYELVPQVTGRPMDDPREIKGLLDGRERLTDFSYQNDLLRILRAERNEERADWEPGVGREA